MRFSISYNLLSGNAPSCDLLYYFTVSNAKDFTHQGPVVQKPINANLGLNLLNLGINFNPRLLCVVQS
jgi:hypothetical protein